MIVLVYAKKSTAFKHSDIYIAASLVYTDDRSTIGRYGHETIDHC